MVVKVDHLWSDNKVNRKLTFLKQWNGGSWKFAINLFEKQNDQKKWVGGWVDGWMGGWMKGRWMDVKAV